MPLFGPNLNPGFGQDAPLGPNLKPGFGQDALLGPNLKPGFGQDAPVRLRGFSFERSLEIPEIFKGA